MKTNPETTFNDLVEQYLGMRLPPPLGTAIDYQTLPEDTQAFIIRMLSLMKRSRYSATAFNPHLLRWLSTTIPSILPSAWGGSIPPITLPDRHKKLDEYVARHNWPSDHDPPVFLDVGCGFPPVTTADTARTLSQWNVFGVDSSFADYVLYDSEGHYACFDQDGTFHYFQAMMTPSGRALYADPEATQKRFKQYFDDLFPLLDVSNGTASETVEKDGIKLIRNHIRNFESDNLAFIQSDINNVDIRGANVIRCMNLLIYFESSARKRMLQHAGRLLDDDGILIAGTNGLGIQSRYTIYRKGADGLMPEEFTFSLDNLGHIAFMSWFTIHDEDPEALLLAELIGVVRSAPRYWAAFSGRLDELLNRHGICTRGTDGFLQFPQEELSPREYLAINAQLWGEMIAEGYLDGAARVLEKAGYDAWRNPVGDLAVRPPAGALDE